MSTYRNIHGRSIQALSTDPTESVAEGQIWYNTNSDTFKSVVALEAWSSASPTNNTRGFIGSLGTQTANLGFGGYLATNTPTNVTEEYNGSGWSTSGNMTNGRYLPGGAGTQTAGLAFGGDERPPGSTNVALTEEYNGTAWSPQNNMNVGRTSVGSAGTQTAGLAFGGPAPSGSDGESTEEYDGTSWTTANGLNAGRNSMVGIGIQTAAVGAGGYGPGYITNVEEYDGTNWTAVTALPVGQGGGCGAGTQTDGLLFGGFVPPAHTVTNRTLNYDGTSWTVSPATMGTARALGGNNNTGAPSSAALAGVGNSSPQYQLTEEYNKSANVITAGAFASGTNLPVSRGQGGGCGTQTAALQCGGIAASPTSNTTTSFEYDGSAWAASPGSLNAATRNNSNFGIQTAAVTIGSIGPISAAVDVYNGSSWTSGTSYPSPVSNIGAAGTTTAGLAWGGDQDPGYLNTTNEYNGSWTSSNTIPAARSNSACAGTQTAGLSVGGLVGPAAPSAPEVASSIEYDGSSWTAGGTDLVARYNAGAAGIQTSALIFGGTTPPGGLISNATLYDGTSFVTQPSMGTARFLQTQGLGATSTVALAAAGQTTTRVATVEEFTGETTAVNVKTLTQS